MKQDAVYRKREEVVSRRIAGELILVPVRGRLADMKQIFSLSPVAEFIWDRIDGRKSFNHILDEIAGSFEVSPEEAAKDLDEFIRELIGADLVSEVF